MLVCGALGCAGAAVAGRRHRAAATLLAGALGSAAADAFGAPAALHVIACALAALAVLMMVPARLGRPSPLTWLDFLMGACAVGALAVTTGAELAATIAAMGVAAGLGLARWRVSPALALALAGLAALGEVPVLAVVPFAFAVWLRERPAVPSPEFNPVVLAALLAYASTAMTLLVVGQFVVAAGGRRRPGDGHDADRDGAGRADGRRSAEGVAPPGGHRRPHRARQPAPPARAVCRRRSARRTPRSRCC